MGIIIFALTLLVLYSVIEVNLKLRQRYHKFSSKFNGYYIDFIVFVISIAIILGIVGSLDFLGLPDSINVYILGDLIIYTVYIIFPN